MAKINTPLATLAQEDAYTGRTVEDAYDYVAIGYKQKILQAVFGSYEWMNEILALHQSKIASLQYRQTFTCAAGLTVGAPVYLSAANTVAAANSTTGVLNQVIGFCRYKPSTTTCYLSHYLYANGLSGLNPGTEIYLTDAGSYSNTAGTVATKIGIAISTTEALVFANPITPYISDATSAQRAAGYFLFPEADLKTPATITLAVPSGSLNPHEAGLILTTLGGTITTQPTIEFGVTGSNAKYRAAAVTVDLTAVGLEEYYESLLGPPAQETSLTATITSGAIGSSTIKGKFWYRGSKQ